MGGHQDGVLAYGADLDSAGSLLLEVRARALARTPREQAAEHAP